jgi:hypothetical protein
MKLPLLTTSASVIMLLQVLTACTFTNTSNETNEKKAMKKKSNPVVYFEIPVQDIDRAIHFYTAVFDFKFEKTTIDHYEMALFPFEAPQTGISGALAKGEVYKPTKEGVIIYFSTDDIEATLKKVLANNGKILYPKTSNGDLGFVAEFEDSEGNRIALHQAVES